MRWLSFVALVGCGADLTSTNVNKDADLEEEVDEDPPVIVHEAVSGTQAFGQDVPITATVTDEGSGVLFVHLYYKNEVDGDADWNDFIMAQSGDVFTGTIYGDDMRGGGVDYYLEAVDRSQNASAAPDEGGDDPYHFRIAE